MKKRIIFQYKTETKQWVELVIDHRKWRSLKRKYQGVELLIQAEKYLKERKV